MPVVEMCGVARSGELGQVWQAWQVGFCFGKSKRGWAGKEMRVGAQRGEVRIGEVRQAGIGTSGSGWEWIGKVSYGKAGSACCVMSG